MEKTLAYLQSKRPDLMPRPGFMRHLAALDQSLKRVTHAPGVSRSHIKRYTTWDISVLSACPCLVGFKQCIRVNCSHLLCIVAWLLGCLVAWLLGCLVVLLACCYARAPPHRSRTRRRAAARQHFFEQPAATGPATPRPDAQVQVHDPALDRPKQGVPNRPPRRQQRSRCRASWVFWTAPAHPRATAYTVVQFHDARGGLD